jgi:hypothetical protein
MPGIESVKPRCNPVQPDLTYSFCVGTDSELTDSNGHDCRRR